MAERLDAFMARANAAYYATHDPFADFTTAPEISQMFGELLGAWVAVAWQMLGSPGELLLVEAGPGRGTLMADALRVISRASPGLAAAARVHFVETSPRLRAEQARLVPGAVWHDRVEDVPDGVAIVLANEFLDALPIRQFVRRADGWAERYVSGGAFAEVAGPGPDRRAAPGEVVEVGEAGLAWTAGLAARLAAQGGVALLLDYGSAESLPGDSLQALRGGRPSDPLGSTGEADLTAHVDFAAVAVAARGAGAAVWGPVPQGVFLERIGLSARAARLAAARPERAAEVENAASRLASPGRMGALFKVVCLGGPGLAAPAGFEA